MALVIVVLVLVLKPGFIDKGTNNNRDNTISATGISQIKVLPDLAAVYLSIETLEDTADESKTENTIISNKVMDSLKGLGLKDSDIETLNYNIYPEYDWSFNKQTLKGYKTVNSIKVKTTDFDLLGDIIDIAVSAGANRVDSIQFELSPEKESGAKKEALEKASRDAREKAEATARGLDLELGKIVSVSAQDYYYRPYPFFGGGLLAEAQAAIKTAVDINPQELETQATVNVVYEIK